MDASAPMLGDWDTKQSKYEAAIKFISKLAGEMHGHNDRVGFGLRVYGHQYNSAQHRCHDSRKEVPFSKDNHAQLYLRLKDIRPKGQGSLSYALEKSNVMDITDTHLYRYSILVLKDTNTVCSDDGCMHLKEIQSRYPIYKTYEVLLYQGVAAQLNDCYGQNFSIANEQEAANTVATILNDFPKAAKQYLFPATDTKKKQDENYLSQPSQKTAPEDIAGKH
jgi:Ca-activated chloride channel homolog